MFKTVTFQKKESIRLTQFINTRATYLPPFVSSFVLVQTFFQSLLNTQRNACQLGILFDFMGNLVGSRGFL
jgi:hypothetical protein